MEGQLWKAIVTILSQINKRRKHNREDYSDEEIVKVFYWAVLHDRPTSWACQRQSWPLYARRKKLPSDTTMSRRLRTPAVRELLAALECRVTRPAQPGCFWMIDGKPLTIGGCSKDRQAGFGRAAGCKAKGYKLHAIFSGNGDLTAWRVAPMNKDERVMAQRLLKVANVQGYVIGDGHYDSNALHQICDARGNRQFVAPRRYGPGKSLGHRSQSPGRLRSKDLLENPHAQFGQRLIQDRATIERAFGNATSWGGGLTHLPPGVRTHRRVERWVQAKLVLNALRRTLQTTTYVD